MNFHCSVTGRKGAREKERGERWRESAEKGLIRRGGFGRDSRPRLLSAPPPISARQRSAGPGLRRGGWGGRLQTRGGGRGHWSRRRRELELVNGDCPNWADEERDRPRESAESARSAGDFRFLLGGRERTPTGSLKARHAGLPGFHIPSFSLSKPEGWRVSSEFMAALRSPFSVNSECLKGVSMCRALHF